jgi:hypothetical protein
MKINRKYFPIAICLILLLLPLADISGQCAMCKQAAETSLKSNPGSMARSLNSGILYLMAVPYLMILFIFRKQIARLWKSRFGKPSKTEIL